MENYAISQNWLVGTEFCAVIEPHDKNNSDMVSHYKQQKNNFFLSVLLSRSIVTFVRLIAICVAFFDGKILRNVFVVMLLLYLIPLEKSSGPFGYVCIKDKEITEPSTTALPPSVTKYSEGGLWPSHTYYTFRIKLFQTITSTMQLKPLFNLERWTKNEWKNSWSCINDLWKLTVKATWHKGRFHSSPAWWWHYSRTGCPCQGSIAHHFPQPPGNKWVSFFFCKVQSSIYLSNFQFTKRKRIVGSQHNLVLKNVRVSLIR